LLTRFSTILGMASVHKGEPPLDNNSSAGGSDEPENVQPYPIPLGDLENIILESTSFSTFRERYRAFLFPQSGLQSLDTNVPKEVHVDVAALGSEPLDLGMGSSLEEEGNESLLRKVFAHVLRRAGRLVRPIVKDGHVRIEWKCVSERSCLFGLSRRLNVDNRIAATTSTRTSPSRMATRFETWRCFSTTEPTGMGEAHPVPDCQ
jgi:hypothetical protein